MTLLALASGTTIRPVSTRVRPTASSAHGVPVAAGSRSVVYARGEDSVAKVPLDTTPSSWIQYEATFTAVARAAGAIAPELRGIETHDGRTVAVYERVAGASMWQHVAGTPHRAADAGVRLARIHASLFALAPPVSLPTLAQRLRTKIRNVAATDPTAAAFVDAVPDGPTSLAMCHGDLHPGNVIMGPRGPVVIDWFDAAVGDPIADVARTLLLLEEARPAHLPGGSDDIRCILAAAYLAELSTRIEIDPTRLAQWKIVHAVARRSEGIHPTTPPQQAPAQDQTPLWPRQA